MEVRATETERGDSSYSTCFRALWPRRRDSTKVEGALFGIPAAVGLLDVERRREDSVVEGEADLYERCDPSRALGVTDL